MSKELTAEQFEKAVKKFTETKNLWNETIPAVENSLMKKSSIRNRQVLRDEFRKDNYLLSTNSDLLELLIHTLDTTTINERYESYIRYLSWLAKKDPSNKK